MNYGGRRSEDSAQRPLSNVDYSQANQGDKGYGAAYGQGYGANERYTDDGAPKKSKKGLYIGLGVLAVLIAAGAAVGGVLGSRASSKNNAVMAAGDSSGNSAAATKTSGSAAGAIVPTATDALGNPLYPTSTGTAKVTPPAFVSNAALSCGADPYSFGDTSSLTVRKEHPLLVAPAYKWNCLPKLIAQDSYMANWNATIFANASKFYDLPPTPYTEDGGLTGSGVLDVAREVQLRIKHWGYAWRLSNDTKWVDRAWTELLTASGNSTTIPFGTAPDRWNTAHFLDLAEFTAAFAIGYDWMYDAWTPTQRNAIMWSIINLGLNYGELSYTSPQLGYGWWSRSPGNTGNWNGVCNNGLTMGALAIANEDPTGVSARILGYTVPNAAVAVSMAPSSDGTWSETPNYWYFGSTGHAQMAASLLSATGSTHNLLDSNPGMKLSSLYHMYVTGMQGMFNYGDTGPNKFTATANALMFYGSQYNLPMYTLYQRDRGDAPEPMSMLYYDPQVTGVFWDGLALDRYFPNGTDSWVSMRSTWTDTQGTYVAMKAGGLQNHQTHGDLDAGTFVLDAMGERWAGELGNGNYLADAYFSSEDQGSVRWEYYRKATEGQNTLLMGGANQIVTGTPQNKYDSTGDQQNALAYTPSKTSTAYFVTDMSSFYNGVSTKRAIRLINGRRQVLLQDEIAVPAAGVQWRMHTNATVAISNAGKTATLSLNGKTLVAQLQSPATASFSTSPAMRLASDPVLPNNAASQDQPNPGVTVLTITLGAGQQTIQVLFNPQWSDLSANANVSPPSVAISAWTLTSHA